MYRWDRLDNGLDQSHLCAKDVRGEEFEIETKMSTQKEISFNRLSVIGCQLTLFPLKEARVLRQKTRYDPHRMVIGEATFIRNGKVVHHGDPHKRSEGISLVCDVHRSWYPSDQEESEYEDSDWPPEDALIDSEFCFLVVLVVG